jgi:hypothetical protein
MSNLKDISGETFGRLTAIEYVGSNKWRSSIWRFQCSCGKVVERNKAPVVRGESRSCGCLKSEVAIATYTKHGAHGTRLHSIWEGMKNRALDDTHKGYETIGISQDWKDFATFREDMETSYLSHAKEYGARNTTIDRIDNSLGYSKENCRWATVKVQANTRKSNILIEREGKTQTLKQWAEALGVDYKKAWERINRYGWDAERALTTA